MTGLDRGVLLELQWPQVDWENRLLHVVRGKTRVAYQVPLGEVAYEVLRGQVRHVRNPCVFLDSAGSPYDSKDRKQKVSDAVTDLARANGLDPSEPIRTLRRTAGSWAAQAGISETIIGRFLGHKRGRTITDRYIHLRPEHFSGIVHALDQAELGRASARHSAPQVERGA